MSDMTIILEIPQICCSKTSISESSTARGIISGSLGIQQVFIVAVKVFLQRLGINLYQFIDDWLIWAVTAQLCALHSRVCLWLLWMLGFYYHIDKSSWCPCRIFYFSVAISYWHRHYRGQHQIWEKIQAQVQLFQDHRELPAKEWQ